MRRRYMLNRDKRNKASDKSIAPGRFVYATCIYSWCRSNNRYGINRKIYKVRAGIGCPKF